MLTPILRLTLALPLKTFMTVTGVLNMKTLQLAALVAVSMNAQTIDGHTLKDECSITATDFDGRNILRRMSVFSTESGRETYQIYGRSLVFFNDVFCGIGGLYENSGNVIFWPVPSLAGQGYSQ